MAVEAFAKPDRTVGIREAIARIKDAREQLRQARTDRPARLLERDRLMNAQFNAGDRVRDRQTGEVFDVVGTSFEAVLTPNPGEGRD